MKEIIGAAEPLSGPRNRVGYAEEKPARRSVDTTVFETRKRHDETSERQQDGSDGIVYAGRPRCATVP